MKKCECSHEDYRIYQEITDELEASYEQLKSTTELLHESEQQYKLLIDNMTDIVWITDSNGIITFINDEVEQILGCKKKNVLGKPLHNFMCPLHRYDNCSDIVAEMRKRDFSRQELWMLHSDGITKKVVETNTRRIYNNDTLVGIQGLGRDITERLQLEKELMKKNKQLSALNEISKQYYLKTIMGLVAAIEAKDRYTQGHSIRVSQYAVEIARELGMSSEEIEEIEIAGILHDIGKIGISDAILTKPGILEPHEFEMVKEHPAIGCRILQPIGLSDNIINATLLHHKRFDLKGYPSDVPAKELPLIANIICAADAYDAMTSYRSYKSPMARKEAIDELKRCSGTQFCPDIVRTMESLYHKKVI